MSLDTGIVLALLGPHTNPGGATTWADMGPGHNDFTLEGALAWVDSASYGSGTYHYGVRFTADADILRATDAADTNCTIARPLTIFLRYYCEGGDGVDARYLVMNRDAGFTNTLGMQKGSNNKFSVNNGSNFVENPAAGPAQGDWVTVGFTSDDDTNKTCVLYINGSAVVTTHNGDAGNGGDFFASPFEFGQVGKNGLGFFTDNPHGVVTDYCLWARALTPTEMGVMDTSSDTLYGELLSPSVDMAAQTVGLGGRFGQQVKWHDGVGLGEHLFLSPALLGQAALGESFHPLDPRGLLLAGLGLGGRLYPTPTPGTLSGGLGLGGNFSDTPALRAALGLADRYAPAEPRGTLLARLGLGERLDVIGRVLKRGRYRR